MTPKEKALELVEIKFDFNGYVMNETNKETSKKFAIKCVNEILIYLEYILGLDKSDFEYWEQVKEEIEKL